MKHHQPIAIIGMGCLFPGCAGLKDYWRLLFNAQDAITDVPATHWSAADYFDPDPKAPDHVYCTRGGFLPSVDFNPVEFGIPPSNLEATDSSQLLALVSAKMALEDAGYGENRDYDKERVSVILGVTGTQELVIPLSARLGYPRWRRALIHSGIPAEKTEEVIGRISDSYVAWQENSFPGLLGNVVAGRICNRLGFGGTNCVVDAACASSLSALNLAILELASGRSDMVITGGVDTLNDIFMHMCFSKTYILSPTGDVRPFSKDADGTLLGEGLGMFVLKRLEDAEQQGDKIYAVMRGLGSSSDGRSQSIYAPRPEGQEKALRMAYEQAEIDPVTVELIEAHGTGTRVGDAVEFEALTRLFSGSAGNGHKCALGSVKSMIGHTKAAAGAAGLMKAALALHHKILPPTLKVGQPDSKLPFSESPFYLNTRTRPWCSRPDHPRRSGVSSFGFGGSNFHVVLEEYGANKTDISWDGSVQILSFSGSSQNELLQSIRDFKQAADTGLSISELANRCAQLRQSFSHEDPFRLLLAHERSQDIRSRLHSALEAGERQRLDSSRDRSDIFYGTGSTPGKLAWVFPGQGSQYVGMGRDLVCLFPQAFEIIEKANRYVAGPAQLSDCIYPPESHSSQEKTDQQDALQQTNIAQPAIGAVSLALARILRHFEVCPEVVCGHSFGELTALCAAGWIAEDDFLRLAVRRGALMAEAGSDSHRSSGAMLAVQAPLEELAGLLEESELEVVLANRNSPTQGVVSGRTVDIEKAQALCRERGLRAVRLPVSAAFHSELVEKARQPFAEALRSIGFSPGNIAVASNTTGLLYPADPDAARRLLSDHLIRPVDFMGEVEHLYEIGVRGFIEIGPKSVLTGLIRSILADRFALTAALDGSHGKRCGLWDLALILCQLAANGFPVCLSKWEDPVCELRKTPISITLRGANYVAPRPKRQDETPEASPDRLNRPNTASAAMTLETPQRLESSQSVDSRGTADQNPNNSAEPLSVASKTGNTMTLKTKPEDADRILQALSIVQEGLRSMQTLQAQTAQAHQKFLESQTEAGRTLQEMMRHTQRLAEIAFGHHPAPTERPSIHGLPQPTSANSEKSPEAAEPMRPAPTEHLDPAAISIPAVRPVGEIHLADPPRSSAAAESVEDHTSELENTLRKVVSGLTGYPVDMLGLDMDIEADLGIDSIKRVEILSTLEEKMPGLPTVSPEMMGRLKTLGQIVAYLAHARQSKSAESSVQQANAPELPPRAGADAALQTPAIETTLLKVVSGLTGYPVDMLGLDMDIEADLGIDSIKRVEILSTLEEKMPGLPTVSPEIMGHLKTLGQIVEFLAASHEHLESTPAGPAELAQLAPVNEPGAGTNQSPAPSTGAIRREVVVVKDAGPRPPARISLPSDARIFVTDDQTGLARSITDVFSDLGISPVLISADILKYKKELPKACGLVFVQNPGSVDPAADLTHAFELVKHLSADLIESSRGGGAVLATVTRLDGMFGLSGNAIQNPVQGGLAGLTKTAALEWPEVLCHAVDIPQAWRDTREIAQTVVQEILTPGPVEIGLSPESRVTLGCEPQATPEGQPNLSTGDVVVISGGARGITSQAAKALSRFASPAVVLIGRSAPPSPEPSWLASLKSEADIKQAILEHEFGEGNAVPAQLEQAFKARMANREILATVESLKADGSVVRYYAADVRDFEGLRTILDEVRQDLGPVKVIIHGAGVVEDRLIADKSIAQFDRVVSTKVAGLQALLRACRQDPLKYLVIFSSVAGRWGNPGQADYACANEAVNKIAQQEAANRPDCRVISINWGPWEGGMVSPSLRREFKRRGVSLIPLEIGAQSLLHEMATELPRPVEVIIGAKLEAAEQPAAHRAPRLHAVSTKSKPALALTFQREIGVDEYPILQSHVIGGKPVVPLALIAEWLGHGALHGNPGLVLHGLDDMRILKGIRLEHPTRTIRILSGKARNRGLVYEVPVELRNGQTDPSDLVHCRATAVLAEAFTAPPPADIPADPGAVKYHRDSQEIYDKILFHGSGLQGIREVVSCSAGGMVARIASAPSPAQWMRQPLRSRWLADPLILDSAFQIASLWCYEERGFVSLPSYMSSYRQYREQLPADGVHVVLDVTEATDRKMRGNFTFLDANGTMVARMTGVEAVMDQSLYQAFKPQYAALS